MKGSMYQSLLRRYCIRFRFMQADGLLDSRIYMGMYEYHRQEVWLVFSLGSISAFSPSEIQPTLTPLLYPSLGSISAFSPSDIRRTLSILCPITNLCFPSEIQRTLSYSAPIPSLLCVAFHYNATQQFVTSAPPVWYKESYPYSVWEMSHDYQRNPHYKHPGIILVIKKIKDWWKNCHPSVPLPM